MGGGDLIGGTGAGIRLMHISVLGWKKDGVIREAGSKGLRKEDVAKDDARVGKRLEAGLYELLVVDVIGPICAREGFPRRQKAGRGLTFPRNGSLLVPCA